MALALPADGFKFNAVCAGDGGHRVVDIYSMGKETRRNLVDAALQTEDQDHEDFLTKLKGRMDEYVHCISSALKTLATVFPGRLNHMSCSDS